MIITIERDSDTQREKERVISGPEPKCTKKVTTLRSINFYVEGIFSAYYVVCGLRLLGLYKYKVIIQ